MPCTSIVVLQQSTHTYVIKLRGSRTIQATVTPNSDPHKGPHQSRSKQTLALHNCLLGLEMTVSWSWMCRITAIGPRWELPGISHDLIGRHLLSVLAFWWMMKVDGWWWEFNGRKYKRGQDILEGLQRCCRSAICGLRCLCVCVCVCVCGWVASKGKRRWLCQGWVITVVFSALRAGQMGVMDGEQSGPLLHASLQPSVWRCGLGWRAGGAGLRAGLGVNTSGPY